MSDVGLAGDPAGMRAAASQLRFRAEQLASLAADVDRSATATPYSGPAAIRWRAAIDEESIRLRSSAARLHDVADALYREAAWVESERQRLLSFNQREPGP